MFLRLIHIVASVSALFLFNVKLYSIVQIYHMGSLDNTHLDCFHFWLLTIMLPWTLAFEFLCGHMISFLMTTYWGVEFLVYRVTQFLTFGELPSYFSKWPYHFTFPPAMNGGSSFSIPSPVLTTVCLFYYNHLLA